MWISYKNSKYSIEQWCKTQRTQRQIQTCNGFLFKTKSQYKSRNIIMWFTKNTLISCCKDLELKLQLFAFWFNMVANSKNATLPLRHIQGKQPSLANSKRDIQWSSISFRICKSKKKLPYFCNSYFDLWFYIQSVVIICRNSRLHVCI